MQKVSGDGTAEISRMFSPVPRLTRRADYLVVAKGDRFHTEAFTLQATALSQEGEPFETARPARFGITATKRIGGAVERNRIKRRFREALRLTPDLPARPGRDYVIVAKAEALTTDFHSLRLELSNAIRKLDRPARQRPSKAKPVRRKGS